MRNRRTLDVDEVDYIYEDRGCDVSPSCLRCPLAVCVYDMPKRTTGEAVSLREKAIAMANEGVEVDAIAKALGKSRRTVFRYLKGGEQ